MSVLQWFLKIMYHAFPGFSIVSGVIALIASAPLIKQCLAKLDRQHKGRTHNGALSPKIVGISLFVFIAAVIMTISGWVNQYFCTEVPNVIGTSVSSADIILERHDLRLELSRSQNKAEALDRIITTQSPEAGLIVFKNSPVIVAHDKGSEPKDESGSSPSPTPTQEPTLDPSQDPTPDPTQPPQTQMPTPTPKPTPMPTPAPTPAPTPTPAQPDFSVSASYRIVPIPLTDKNCEINAYTSVRAERVTVSAVSAASASETYEMKTDDGTNWTFAANFYAPGTYTVTVTAYAADGTQVQDSFSITYPFNSLFI